jgi:hypothetical protein
MLRGFAFDQKSAYLAPRPFANVPEADGGKGGADQRCKENGKKQHAKHGQKEGEL